MKLNGNITDAKGIGGAINRKASFSGALQRATGGGSSDVFWATYGTTTIDELNAAYQAGKILMLEYQNSIYYLEDRSSTMYVFHCMENGQTSGVGITLKQILYTSTYNTWAYYEYDALAANQYAQNAGKYLAVDNSGNVIPKAAPMAIIPSGACDSTSTSTAFTATVSGITALTDGVCVWLTNGVVTSAAGCTLNINSLGAKPIYASQSAATAITTQFNINYTALLIYNSTRVSGGCWDYVYGYETNTTYTPVKLGFGYATCDTAAATAAKTAALSSYTLTSNGIVSIKFTNAVGAGATLNINSKGAKAIYYRGSAITAGVIEAGDTATFIYSTYYHLVSIDRPDLPGGGTAGQVLKKTANGTEWADNLSPTQIQDAVDDYLGDHPTVTGTFTNEAKRALISLLEKVAYIDGNGQSYLDTLESELFTASVASIAAVFTQGQNVIYDTDSLDTLKQYLVVTATYSDSTTATVTDYTLSGTLAVGTSIITVSYSGKSDTFSVTVTDHSSASVLYNWEDLGSSLTDSKSGIVATTTGTQTPANNCILFSAMSKYIDFGEIYAYDRTYVIEFGESSSTNTTGHARFFAVDADSNTSSGGSVFAYRGNYGFCFYTGTWGSTLISGTDKRNIFANSELRIYIDSSGKAHAYKDGTFIGSTSGIFKATASGLRVYIGGSQNDNLATIEIKSMVVYSGEVV